MPQSTGLGYQVQCASIVCRLGAEADIICPRGRTPSHKRVDEHFTQNFGRQLPYGGEKRPMKVTGFGNLGPSRFQAKEAESQLGGLIIEFFQLLDLLMDEAA